MLKTLLFITICVSTLLARDFVLETSQGRVTFEAQTDRIAVGWTEGRNLEQQAERLAGMKDVAHPPLDRVIAHSSATVICLTRFLSDLEGDELAENLLVSEGVAWLAPALYFEGESFIPSDKIRLRADAYGLSAREIAEFGLREIRTLADGTVIATRPRSSALDVVEFCNSLTELPSVLWCEPLWLEGHALNQSAPIDTPRVTIHRSGDDVVLNWQWCGNVRYEVWSSAGEAEPQLEAMVEDTHFTDAGALTRHRHKLYEVRALAGARSSE